MTQRKAPEALAFDLVVAGGGLADRAGGVAFGDPLAILAQIPSHCRLARVAV